MAYHPEFHPNHGKDMTDEERAYLCKFYDYDGWKNVAMALGRTEKAISNTYSILKKKGLVNYYSQMWDKQFE